MTPHIPSHPYPNPPQARAGAATSLKIFLDFLNGQGKNPLSSLFRKYKKRSNQMGVNSTDGLLNDGPLGCNCPQTKYAICS